MANTTKQRDSNFELLRLIAMYMIVLIHANVYIGDFMPTPVGAIYNPIINGICNTGVSLFILISGYYGVSFNIKKITKLECKMITYSLLVFGLSLVVYAKTMTDGDKLELLIKSVLPFASRNHWFYSCYILIVLFSGFINRFVDTLDKKSFRTLLMLMLFCFSVLPTCFYFEIVQDNGKGIVQMLMVYLMGRYIRMSETEEKIKMVGVYSKWKLALIIVVVWLINAISFSNPINFGGIYHTLCKDNSITNMILAVSAFLLFKDLKFKSKVINAAAKYIFAVFAMNYILVDMLFEKLIESYTPYHEPSILGVFVMLGASFLVLAGCIIVGIIRDFLLGWLDEKISNGVERAFSEIERLYENTFFKTVHNE